MRSQRITEKARGKQGQAESGFYRLCRCVCGSGLATRPLLAAIIRARSHLQPDFIFLQPLREPCDAFFEIDLRGPAQFSLRKGNIERVSHAVWSDFGGVGMFV